MSEYSENISYSSSLVSSLSAQTSADEIVHAGMTLSILAVERDHLIRVSLEGERIAESRTATMPYREIADDLLRPYLEMRFLQSGFDERALKSAHFS